MIFSGLPSLSSISNPTMPKATLKKQLLSAKISQLEEELKNLPDEMFIDDDFYPDSSKRSSAKDFDADFFDIEREGNKKPKDVKTTKSDLGSKKARDYKPHFQPRGRGSRGRILVGRARGNRGRVSVYRGGFRPSFKPQKSQDLYNDEEDWARYVAKSRDVDDSSTREGQGQPSSSSYDTDNQSSSGKNRFIKSFEFSKNIKEIKSNIKDIKNKQEDKDMFYFPNEKSESKPTNSNKERPSSPVKKPDKEKLQETGVNKELEVMNLFEELQAKLSSSAVNIPGFDILADTLKKLEKFKDDKCKDKNPDEGTKDDKFYGDKRIDMSSDKVNDDDINESSSRSSEQKREKLHGFMSKPKPNFSRDKSYEDDKESNRKTKQLEDKRDSLKESSPLRTVKYSGSSWNKESSPSRKRDHSPYRKDDVSNRKRDSPSPSRKRVSSPVRKRGRSPSPPPHRRRSPPYQRRRKSPSPSHRHRRDSASPRRRRIESGSPPRRRDSGEYEPRKRRESDWYPRRSPKRMRSRSKSRSPRRDHRRRSSSRSPRRWNDRKKELSLSLSPSPVLVRSQSREKEMKWYKGKQPDPMLQPEPPGGESSDVCAKVSQSETNVIMFFFM